MLEKRLSPFHTGIILVCVVITAFNVLAFKVAAPHLSPLTFSLIRSLFVLPIALYFFKPLPPLGQVVVTGTLFGILMTTSVSIGFLYGLSAGVGALILQTGPFFILFFSYLHFKQLPSKQQLVGMCIGFCGVGIMAIEQGVSGTLMGFFFMVLGTLFWAHGIVLMKKFSPKHLMSFQAWMIAFPILPLALLIPLLQGTQETWLEIQAAPYEAILAAAFSGVVMSYLGGGAWNRINMIYSPNHTAPFMFLVPFIGGGVCYTCLDELMTLIDIIAGLVILVGLCINQGYIQLYKKA